MILIVNAVARPVSESTAFRHHTRHIEVDVHRGELPQGCFVCRPLLRGCLQDHQHGQLPAGRGYHGDVGASAIEG